MHRCIKASEGTHKYAQFLCIKQTEKEKPKREINALSLKECS
jgi:tRNA U38,U39,U40 pseudouridine synthase TruA